MIKKLEVKEIDFPIESRIILKKIWKRGKSCIPVGNKRVLIISQKIIIGKEIFVYYENARPHPSGDKRYCTYHATSKIFSIQKITKKLFFVKTETSTYSLTVI